MKNVANTLIVPFLDNEIETKAMHINEIVNLAFLFQMYSFDVKIMIPYCDLSYIYKETIMTKHKFIKSLLTKITIQ